VQNRLAQMAPFWKGFGMGSDLGSMKSAYLQHQLDQGHKSVQLSHHLEQEVG